MVVAKNKAFKTGSASKFPSVTFLSILDLQPLDVIRDDFFSSSDNIAKTSSQIEQVMFSVWSRVLLYWYYIYPCVAGFLGL